MPASLPPPLERLLQALVRLPGIGPRSARRLAFYLAKSPPGEVKALAEAIAELPSRLAHCRICGNFSEGEICEFCADPRRETGTLCVVEQPDNLAAIEGSGAYHGLYHVLGGAISPLKSMGPKELRIDSLLERLADGKISEVILATNPTVEGEATALYLARRLARFPVRVTRPATGLPVGGELDYVDRSTLSRAFEGRREV